MIAGISPDGAIVQEMHVDGGVTAPFLAIPEQFLDFDDHPGEAVEGDIYVLVNGQVGPVDGQMPRTAGRILGRSYEALSKANTRAHLAATAAFAARHGLRLSVESIPETSNASSLDFRPEAMEQLFELGRARAKSGEAWSRTSQASGQDDKSEATERAIAHP